MVIQSQPVVKLDGSSQLETHEYYGKNVLKKEKTKNEIQMK